MKKFLLIIILMTPLSTMAQQAPSWEEAIKPYIEKLLVGIDKGVDIATQEVPVIVQQYLAFEAFFYWMIVSLGVVVSILIYLLFRKLKESSCRDGEEYAVLVGGNAIAAAIIFSNLVTAVKVTFFPKLYLLEKFMELL